MHVLKAMIINLTSSEHPSYQFFINDAINYKFNALAADVSLHLFLCLKKVFVTLSLLKRHKRTKCHPLSLTACLPSGPIGLPTA
jgi:hypothetical protein